MLYYTAAILYDSGYTAAIIRHTNTRLLVYAILIHRECYVCGIHIYITACYFYAGRAPRISAIMLPWLEIFVEVGGLLKARLAEHLQWS